jgi:cell wall-associated NlpC family hydrolase
MREKIVAEARSWIGTPYHNCADIKGVGVDCGMLLVRVYCDLGLVPRFDPRPYTAQWHLHRDDERYLDGLTAHAKKVDAPQLGDAMLFRVGRAWSHGGIVTRADPLVIVHASQPAGIVLEESVFRNGRLRAAPAMFACLVGDK